MQGIISRVNKYLLFSIGIGFILRIIAINHGEPYIFNIDEPAIIRSGMGVAESFEITHFDWPHFPFYFNYAIYFIFIKLRGLIQVLGFRESIEAFIPVLWNDPFIFYLLTRITNAILGTLSLIPLYLTARDAFNKRIAEISALLFSVTPFLVEISKIAVPDPILFFFVSYAIYFVYKLSEKWEYKYLALSGVFFGIASGIKYNAILVAVFLVFLTLLKYRINDPKDRSIIIRSIFPKLILFGLISTVTFLITTPSIISEWDVFWSYENGRGFLWQLFVNSSPLGINEYIPALVMQMWTLGLDLGLIPLLLFIVAGVLLLFRPKTNEKVTVNLVAFILTSILVILFTNRYDRAGTHYFITVFGMITIAASWVLFLVERITKKRLATILVLVILLSWSLYKVSLFLAEDTRNTAIAIYEQTRTDGGKVYWQGESLSELRTINNLKVSSYDEDLILSNNDVLISEKMYKNDDNIILIRTIDNSHRRGPVIYVYQKAN